MKSSRWLAAALSPCVLASALALPCVAQAAGATQAVGTQVGPPTALVRFTDLNPATPAGAEALFRRIQRAARNVCEPLEPVVGTLIPSAAWRRCMDQAIGTAVRRVDQPLLTAYYQREQGHVTDPGRLLTRLGE